MSGQTPQQTPIMGGLEALVAAANAANQTRPNASTQHKRKRDVDDAMIDPALQNDNNDALLSLFSNPAFLNALASTVQSPMNAQALPQPAPYVYTNDNDFAAPNQNISSGPLSAPTPFQQTRSGRISRPPAQPAPQYNLLQSIAAEADSPNFDNVLKTLSEGKHPAQPQSQAGDEGYGETLPRAKRRSRYDLEATGLAPYANVPSQAQNQHASTTQWTGETLAGLGQADHGDRSMSQEYDIAGEMADSPDGLPRWPLPPSGAGGRKAMSKEEITVRRRERNRVAASEARRRKRDYFDAMESRLYKQEEAHGLLQTHCRNLEEHIHKLERIIQDAGLNLPTTASAPNSLLATGLLVNRPMGPPAPPTPAEAAPPMPSAHSTTPIPFVQATPDLGAVDTPATFASYDESPLPPFDMFFNVDMDGEDDGEFLPPSSPPDMSDTEGEKRNGKKGKGKKAQDEDDDDDFEDDDVEDEDLFLPIEDVPVPPAAQMESAMRSLGVDNQEQLASLINKMVQSGKEGMTSEMVDKLKVLLSLVGPNGSWKQQK